MEVGACTLYCRLQCVYFADHNTSHSATARTEMDVNIGLELSEAYNLVDRYLLSK